MTNIVNLFTKQIIQPPLAKEVFLRAQTHKHKITTEYQDKSTQKDLEASAEWNFREDWVLTQLSAKKINLNIDLVEREHHVHLHDMGRAIAIAYILKQDSEAVDYFTNLITQVTIDKLFYVNLGQIPDTFKGYVWASDFRIIVNASAYAEHQLWRIMGHPVTRKIYF